MTPVDHAERERALDPARSFIVQAPAGSGKTELLIQRYLRLLGVAARPESVVAITFTKKAAAEMQRRVLDALEAAGRSAPDEDHKRKTWTLARAVLGRNEELGWDLADNPRRLSIRTIDSLCASLVRNMPWLSRLGPRLEPVEDAAPHFLAAAQRTVDLLEEDRYGDAIEPLLRHVDNNQGRLVNLLAAMLAHREQWLRHVFTDRNALRERFETLLRREVEGSLERVRAVMPPAVAENAVELIRHAAGNLRGGDKLHEIQQCIEVTALPCARAADLPYWRALPALLLTAKGEPRAPRGITKAIGFPTTSPLKNRMCEMVDGLPDHLEFCSLLHEASKLPDPKFDEAQWAVLEALLVTLPAAAGQLRLVFGERGQVDFAALTEAALRALGEEDAPTDLALALDASIEHLLVDEFQDTSHSQMRLLEKLTLGWTPGDGRTVFLVGDPMQSIYRFREAEVGLFLRTVKRGLPSVEITPLRLSVNFRSRRNIVDWVNRVFPDVFAKEENVALGAVRFSRSDCASQDGPGPEVRVHPFLEPAGAEGESLAAAREASAALEIIQAARADGKTVAVLARSRSHLPRLLMGLRSAGIRYSAVEIDPLGSSPAVQDLLALTSALLHPGDRVSWLAILRAPWCGLSLADLHALAADKPKAAICDLLGDAGRIALLSPEGQAGVARLILGLAAPRPRTLRAWVEGVWLRLGGPATVAVASGLDDAEAFFNLLEGLDQGCDGDLDRLRADVRRLFAAPDPAAGQSVQVMTIHKAKGLEFDVVILPGLGRPAKVDEDKLMLWLERPPEDESGEGDLLLAPMKSAAVESDAIYRFVRDLERQKERHELARLLYVAVTRAKEQLHLLGSLGFKDGEVKEPGANTLLRLLWATVGPAFEASAQPEASPEDGASESKWRPLRRLAADWQGPELELPALVLEASVVQESSEGRDRWAGHKRRIIGTMVHDVLQEIGREGAQHWTAERVRAAKPRFAGGLRAAGLPEPELAAAAGQVEDALVRAVEDERGRWILDSSHQDARSEVAFAGMEEGHVVERRVDRTFIDRDGVRWVIDFKTTPRKKGDIEGMLRAQMERYRRQMEDYRALYRRLEDRPVRIGLYFPLLGAWREYEESAGASV